MGRFILSLVILDDTGDSKYRLEWPMKALSRKFPTWRVENLRADSKERFTLTKEADLLFLVQCSDIDLIPIIEERKVKGLPTVVEYNDNFYEPPSWSPIAKEWGSPLLWRSYESLMEVSDHIITTSDYLKSLFCSVTRTPISVIENILPAPPPSSTMKSKKPSLGWAGSLGHMADLISIQRELKSLSKDFEVHLMGNESIPQVLNIQGLHFTNWSSIERYYSFWDPIWFGVIPLKDTNYNRGRSDIKIIEMLSRSVVPVVTYSQTYMSLIDKLGLPTFKEPSEIESVIRGISENSRNEILKRGLEYIKNNRVTDSKRINLYLNMLEKVPEREISNPGYFETTGTSYPTSKLHEILTHSPESIKEFCDKNQKNPDAFIVLLKQNLSSPNFKNLLLEAIERFPKDLRFKIFYFEKFGESLDIIRYLKDSKTTERRFWQKMIIESLGKNKDHQDELLELYPADSKLLFLIAERLRQNGDFQSSHELYLRLRSLKTTDEFITALDPAYLDAMIRGTE